MADETLERPAKAAAKAEHVAWAVLVHGMTEADAEAMTKEQLLELPDAPEAEGNEEPAAEPTEEAPAATEEDSADDTEEHEGPATKLFRGEGGAVIRMALPLPEVMADQVAKGTLVEVEE